MKFQPTKTVYRGLQIGKATALFEIPYKLLI